MRKFITLAGIAAITTLNACTTSPEATGDAGRQVKPRTIVKANTECRAGCQGNTTGCQESWETAVLSASPGMRLYSDSLIISRSWPGGDTTGLAKEPKWEITMVPAGDKRPVSISVKPILSTCVGSNADKQSRTHYEWSAAEDPQ